MTVVAQSEQRNTALATANRRRLAQSKVRMEIRQLNGTQGAHLAADVLANRTDEDLQAMSVLALLLSVHRVGQHKALHLLDAIGIIRRSTTVRLRDLTERQRLELAMLLLDERGDRAA